MSDIKQKAREMFNKMFIKFYRENGKGYWTWINPDPEIIENSTKDLIDQIIDLAIAERDKEIVEMIESQKFKSNNI